MKKINNLVAGVAMLGAVASTQAQQVVKRITHNTNNTIVEMFVLRNGTALPNTTGNFNFDTGASDNKGNVIVYNPALANTYSHIQAPTGTTSHDTEQVGNGTFPFDGNQANTFNNQSFIANGGSGATLNITIPAEHGNADSTQDGNTLSDMMYSKFILKNTLDDGSAIPDGLIVKCLSRLGKDNNSGATAISRYQAIVQRNQEKLSWSPITTDRLGFTPPTLEEIGNDGQVLGTNDFDRLPILQMKAYPNPATDTITLDDGDQLNNDFDFEIYDITGKKVGSGQGKEGQPINITHLTGGTYILSHKDDEGHRGSSKIIKK